MVLGFTLAACSGGEYKPGSRVLVSPPPPAEAPASVVEKVAAIPQLGVDKALLVSASQATPQGGGQPLGVALKDPGGSGQYAFDPSKLSFKVSDSISFTLRSETEFHTFTSDGLGIDQAVDAGQAVTFSFTFTKPGTYRLICIPHESLGMVGTITVSQ